MLLTAAGNMLPEQGSQLLIGLFLAMLVYAPIFLVQYLLLALPVRRRRRRFWLEARHFDFLGIAVANGKHGWRIAPPARRLRPPAGAVLLAIVVGLGLTVLAAGLFREAMVESLPAWLVGVGAAALVAPLVLYFRFGRAQASWVARAVRHQLAARFDRHLLLLDAIAENSAKLAAACARLNVTPPPSPLDDSRDLILQHAQHPALAKADAAEADLAHCAHRLREEITGVEAIAAELVTVGEAIHKARNDAHGDAAREVEHIELTLYSEAFLADLAAWRWDAGRRHLASIHDRLNAVLIDRSAAGLGSKRAAPGSTWLPSEVGEAYGFLNINPNAEDAAIKTLVNAMRKNWHPDFAVNQADRAAREAKMKQINVAWDMIRRQRAMVEERA